MSNPIEAGASLSSVLRDLAARVERGGYTDQDIDGLCESATRAADALESFASGNARWHGEPASAYEAAAHLRGQIIAATRDARTVSLELVTALATALHAVVASERVP